MVRTTEHPASFCPHCDKPLTASTALDDETPEEGDLSVCIHCAAVIAYRADHSLRAVTMKEMEKLSLANRIKLAVFVEAAKKLKGMA